MLVVLEGIKPVEAVVVGENFAVILRAEVNVNKLFKSLEPVNCRRSNAVCKLAENIVVDCGVSLSAEPLYEPLCR